MENFLINLAVIKVNWDESKADILDNYMPLVGYAIRACEGDVVSQQAITDKLEQIAEFRILQGALNVLIRRAAKKKYSYITKQGPIYM